MPKRAEKPEVAEAIEPKTEAKSNKTTKRPAEKQDKKVVEKFPTLEKAKKYLEKVRKGLSGEIFDAKEIEAGKQGEQKVRIVFMNFSKVPKSDSHEELTPEEDAYNVERIKDALFYYHTGKDDSSDNAVVLQVITPADEDGFHLLAYQEISDK